MPGQKGNTNRRGSVGASVHLASRTPTTADLHWAAGFLEGEGCFAPNRGSSTIDAAQINPEPLQKILEIFGGTCKLRHPAGKNAYWRWMISGSRARGVMMTLYPLLSTKRQEQIEFALKV